MGHKLSGFAYDSAGAPLTGKNVNLYDRNTTTNARGTVTTDGSTGKFEFEDSDITVSSVYQFDIEIVDGSNKTRYKYDDEIMLQRVDVKDFVLRSGSANQYLGTVVPETLTADRTYTLPNHTGEILVGPSVNINSSNQMFLNDTASSSLNTTAGLCINGGNNTVQMIELKTGN